MTPINRPLHPLHEGRVMRGKLTTRTADVIARMAVDAVRISDALHEAGFKEEADEMDLAASRLSIAASSVTRKLEAYATAALSTPSMKEESQC